MKTLAAILAIALLASPALAQTARIVVPAHDIPRGATISESDLVFRNAAPGQMFSGTATAMDEISGMQARRYLRAGESLRTGDVRHPVLVTKGSPVTMVFNAPGITLSATGKAMSEGGMGEVVTVLNPISYRQISAVVTGPGQVRAGDAATAALPSAPRLAQN